MKNIIIILFTISFISCKAQSPIIPLYDGNEYGQTNNAYYKDTYNDFNQFVGTWLYINPNNSEQIKIIIKKKEQDFIQISYDNSFYYSDYLYGEYKYTDVQGNVLVNSLSEIDNTSINIYEHLIYGNDIINYEMFPFCDICSTNERRVFLTIKDPERSHFGYKIVIRHFSQSINGESIIIKISTDDMNIMKEGVPNDSRLPFNEFTLIKL